MGLILGVMVIIGFAIVEIFVNIFLMFREKQLPIIVPILCSVAIIAMFTIIIINLAT